MAGRLSLGGFAAAGLMRSPASSRASVTAAACRVRVAAALRGSSSARRRFSEEWTNNDESALLETIGDVDRAPQPLPPPSPEQAAVVRSVRDRVNVVCEAVAGSGKTTTVLHCARDVPDLTFLVLTYNARLKLTTRQRARELGLSNVETHSFHACAARYYLPGCRDDEALRRLVEEDAPPRSALRFDCLVVVEAQDMTPLLHRFVLKVLRDAGNARSTQMLVLGDSWQSIYQFRDAEPRFLTMADRGVYALAETPFSRSERSAEESSASVPAWRHHTLRTSFRASPRIASFVNDAMLGFECIRASPREHLPDGGDGAPVTYMVGNAFAVASQEIADEIEHLLSPRGGGYAPDDIFVLTPSLKGAKLNSKTPLAQLENTLVMRCGVPVYVSLADEEELSDALTRGKICFTTFHSSKGLERPVVIVFGFSGDYFTYFARDAPKAVCPNTLYVAATRASERLYVVGEQEEGGKLPFLRLDPAAFEKWGVPLPPWLERRTRRASCRLKELDYRSGRSFVCINTREAFATGDRVDGVDGVEGVSRFSLGARRLAKKMSASSEGSSERERSLLLLLAGGVVLAPLALRARVANLAPGHVRRVAPGAGLARPALDARRPRRGDDFGVLRGTGNANGAW